MKKSSKKRRSERLPAAVRLLLTIQGPSGAAVLKEVITTVEVSQYGARLRGRRPMEVGLQGVLIQLSSGRQTPFRVAWQIPSPDHPAYLDTGVELMPNLDFWGRTFSSAPEPPPMEVVLEDATVSPAELLQALSPKSPEPGDAKAGQLLETVWCGLVEQLEERNVFTRAELVASIRRIAQPGQTVSQA